MAPTCMLAPGPCFSGHSGVNAHPFMKKTPIPSFIGKVFTGFLCHESRISSFISSGFAGFTGPGRASARPTGRKTGRGFHDDATRRDRLWWLSKRCAGRVRRGAWAALEKRSLGLRAAAARRCPAAPPACKLTLPAPGAPLLRSPGARRRGCVCERLGDRVRPC